MYIGIDLGTSNSSIARYSEGAVTIALSMDGDRVLPSILYIGSHNSHLFGRRAYEQTLLDPSNVIGGFKRLMGTSTPIQAACGITLSPEEASSEIIRQLLSQLNHPIADIEGCVITIPAAFNQMQCEATLRAARAAGLEQVALLQEPIAASMAAMATQNKSGLFLVYDLGGGTFDVALVHSIGASLNVLDNLGINMLGGRDFDQSILVNHVLPALKAQYQLPDDLFKNPRYSPLLRVTQMAIEKAKIELSSREHTVIVASADLIACQDQSGREIMLEVALDRQQLCDLIAADVQETVTLCQRILSKNGYAPTDIAALVFIGGPSKMPWLREHVAGALQIEADLCVDPMTAVCEGAAIFAESRHWANADTVRKQTRSRTHAGTLAIRYDYANRVTRDEARIKVIIEGQVAEHLVIQVDSTLGWTSGKIPLQADTQVRVPIPAQGDNYFKITVFDGSGQPLADASAVLTITRVYASVSGIPATHTIAAKVLTQAADGLENGLDPIIEKGTLLPTQGIKKFRAARTINAGQEEFIDLELYQQENPTDKPENCLAIGAFRIKGADLLPGMAVYKGDEIICQWTMNDSGVLRVAIDIPSVGQTFDTGHMYVDAVGHRNFDRVSGEELVKASLEQTTLALKDASEVVGDEDQQSLAAAGQKLQEQRRAFAQSHQPEDLRRITEHLRAVRQKIASAVNAPANKARVEKKRVEQLAQVFEQITAHHPTDELTLTRFKTIANNARAELDKGDEFSIKEASRLATELSNILNNVAFSLPDIVTHSFREHADKRAGALDKALHDRLAQEGFAALEKNDFSTVRSTTIEMINNMIEHSDIQADVSELAGLMRG